MKPTKNRNQVLRDSTAFNLNISNIPPLRVSCNRDLTYSPTYYDTSINKAIIAPEVMLMKDGSILNLEYRNIY